MRNTLATLAAVTISACFIMAGIGSLYSQTFTNPVTIMYLTSSTGQPVGVSPQNPLPVTSSGGGGAVTIADGADVAEGSTTDAAATAGSTGTLSAKLRLMTTQLNTILGGIITTGTAGAPSTQVITVQDISGGVKNAEAAGENHIGEVGGNIIPISVALTTSNNSVTTGKSIGGTITFANAARVSAAVGSSGTSGILQNLSLFFKDAVVGTSADLYLFNASPSSTCTDNTTFALSNSDLAKVVGIVHITDFTASNTGIIAQANNIAMAYGLSSATSLFGCLVARGTFAITTTSGAEIIVNTLRQ